MIKSYLLYEIIYSSSISMLRTESLMSEWRDIRVLCLLPNKASAGIPFKCLLLIIAPILVEKTKNHDSLNTWIILEWCSVPLKIIQTIVLEKKKSRNVNSWGHLFGKVGIYDLESLSHSTLSYVIKFLTKFKTLVRDTASYVL